jgi:lipid II:glycine glycyltransferase (peptidoglycan interpeptide bridge formation enzyme)
VTQRFRRITKLLYCGGHEKSSDPFSSGTGKSKMVAISRHKLQWNGNVTRSADFTVEVDTLSERDWSSALETFEDANIYQTRAYGEVRWGPNNLSHLVLKREGRIRAMAQLRVVPLMGRKFGMAYLRWGPLCHLKTEPLHPEVADTMASALFQEYAKKRRMFLQVVPNAYLGTERASILTEAFRCFNTETFVPGSTYRTFVLDLDPPLDELRRNLEQKWRNMLNNAEKKQLKIIAGNNDELFEQFIPLYEEMHARKQFGGAAQMQDFLSIQKCLPSREKMRVLLCQENGVLVSGVVVTGLGDFGIYLHGATSNAGMKARGSYRLQWETIKWLKEKGIRYYDLGGINPEANPGVYHFKCGFSAKDVLYLPPFSAYGSPVAKLVGVGAALIRSKRWKHLKPKFGMSEGQTN